MYVRHASSSALPTSASGAEPAGIAAISGVSPGFRPSFTRFTTMRLSPFSLPRIQTNCRRCQRRKSESSRAGAIGPSIQACGVRV